MDTFGQFMALGVQDLIQPDNSRTLGTLAVTKSKICEETGKCVKTSINLHDRRIYILLTDILGRGIAPLIAKKLVDTRFRKYYPDVKKSFRPTTQRIPRRERFEIPGITFNTTNDFIRLQTPALTSNYLTYLSADFLDVLKRFNKPQQPNDNN